MIAQPTSFWESVTAGEAEMMAAGMYAGERAAKQAAMKPARGGFDTVRHEEVEVEETVDDYWDEWHAINWRNVEPLDDDEKSVWDTSDYLSIPF